MVIGQQAWKRSENKCIANSITHATIQLQYLQTHEQMIVFGGQGVKPILRIERPIRLVGLQHRIPLVETKKENVAAASNHPVSGRYDCCILG